MSGILFESREAFGNAVLSLHETYQPSIDVVRHMHRVDTTTVTGPSAAGKDTVMKRTGLHRVLSDTTRDPRVNDGVLEQDGVEYYFRGNDLDQVYHDIIQGDYVQWAPGPGGNIYGSRDEAYPPSGPALIDVVARAIPKLREIRSMFHSMASIYVVADSYPAWLSRLDGRGKISAEDRHHRLLEGLDSLQAGLDDEEMHFVLNDDPDKAAERLTRIARRIEAPSEREQQIARKCGYAMLTGLKQDLGLPQIIPVS